MPGVFKSSTTALQRQIVDLEVTLDVVGYRVTTSRWDCSAERSLLARMIKINAVDRPSITAAIDKPSTTTRLRHDAQGQVVHQLCSWPPIGGQDLLRARFCGTSKVPADDR